MIAPPLTVEHLLEGLSAKSDFRDGILGDLAEEFAERAESEGVAAAKRWYYREAIGVAPHLFFGWLRSLRFREVRRLVNVLFASHFLMTVLATLIQMMLRGALETLGIDVGLFARSSPGDFPAGGLAIVAVVALMCGYCAASLDKKTPLASAILLGIVWASLSIALTLIFSTGAPVGYLIAGASLMFVGTAAGGMLQVRNSRFSSAIGSLE